MFRCWLILSAQITCRRHPLGVYSTDSISKPASTEPVINENFKDVTHQSPAKSPLMSPASDLVHPQQYTSELWKRCDQTCSSAVASCAHQGKKKVRLESELSFTFLCFTAWSQTGVACSCRNFNELQ